MQSGFTILTFGLIGCATPPTAPPEDRLSEAVLKDSVPLPKSNPTLQDMALTFPVFEMEADEIKEAINRRDLSISSTKTRWMLEGDGAQPTIVFDQISSEGEEPVKVSLTVGSLLDAPPTIYTYERIVGSWRFIKQERQKNAKQLAATCFFEFIFFFLHCSFTPGETSNK